MALPYSYTTLGTVLQQLANRLYDAKMVFWTSAELTLYVQEALQTWNALAQYWRGDFVFNTGAVTVGWGQGGFGQGPYGGGVISAGTWYDLTQQANTLRPYTVTDVNLYTIIEYHLLEPATGATWTGTTQFSIDDVMNAVQRRRDEVLDVTGCTVTQSLLPTTPGVTRNSLNDSVLDVRRIAWMPTPASQADTSAVPNVMWPEDAWSLQAFQNGYTTAAQGTPTLYALSTQPPLSFDVNVGPNRAGQYELLTVNAGGVLTAAQPTLIPIPADFCWVLKWGALADLFGKEAEAKDEGRAEYCNQRYQQGLKLMMGAPAVLQLRVNNVPVWVDAVRAGDEYATAWQSQTPGVPQNAYVAGLNLLALSPAPDSVNTYAITATVVQNAPLPSVAQDFVQVSRGDLDAILDYAQHLALLKCGGAEFAETKELYARFVRQAAIYNGKLAEMGCFEEQIYGISQREEMMNPRLTKSLIENLQGGQQNG